MPYSKVLKINDYTPPAPDEGGVVIGRQKIWSENTKRNANCKMVGDIKAIKATLSITWSKLTQAELYGLDKAINKTDNPFFPITYVDQAGNEITKKFYSDSSIEYTRQKYRKTYNHETGEWEHTDIFYTDVTVNFVEQ